MNKTNEHLNSSVQEESAGLAHFKDSYCSCMDCHNLATKKLRVVHQIIDGYYCNSCASDLCWHGITLEDLEYER